MNKVFEVPDFETMANLIDEIHALSTAKALLEVYIKQEESEIVKKATAVSEGKPPSMEYIKNSLMITGFDGSLIQHRNRLAEVSADLDKAKNLLQLSRDILDVWRTKQANERSALV